jgi:pimeloyl-ACP methyl ester carboxylesterase
MEKVIIFGIRATLFVLSVISRSLTGKVGFYIFCYPFAKTLNKFQKAFLQTAEQELLPFEDGNLRLYKWGSGTGQKILLMHGWASHSYRWKIYIEKLLQKGFQVYAFDAPGHGLSDGKIANIIKYSNALSIVLREIKGVHAVVTHSFGGITAIHYLLQHGFNALNRIVIIASPGEANDFFNFYKAKLGLSKRIMDAIVSHFEKVLKQPPSFFSAANMANNFDLPALIVHDVQDNETPYKHAVNLNKAWRNSKLLTTEAVGHQMRNEEVMEAVIAFCEIVEN